jgi:hypothetical protein
MKMNAINSAEDYGLRSRSEASLVLAEKRLDFILAGCQWREEKRGGDIA